ncbi:hypothetical protein [Filimonas effusa]|uniref:Uncharacterized protein n=1 Tax=Filimonas effusa TaxID=2508721 RepID=A0A4Q1D0Y8_9BACT|nr:hypothetical protein [Filimonas effusa]RXK81424.1 hypothetical protein ESB13_21055 [Filimonas effusa]
MKANQYIKTVEAYYIFLVTEFGFDVSGEKIRGNAFYDVQYKDGKRIVSISYENIEDYFLITIFLLQNGEMPDYDDKTKTLHLNKLNAQILSVVDKSEISLNNECFFNFSPQDMLEKKLLKGARELRLCLRHFEKLQMSL